MASGLRAAHLTSCPLLDLTLVWSVSRMAPAASAPSCLCQLTALELSTMYRIFQFLRKGGALTACLLSHPLIRTPSPPPDTEAAWSGAASLDSEAA